MGVPKLEDSNLDSGDGFFNWVVVEYCMLLIGPIPWLWVDYCAQMIFVIFFWEIQMCKMQSANGEFSNSFWYTQ